MFVNWLWFSSTPGEPHAKKGDHFPGHFSESPISAEKKSKPESGHLFSKPKSFFFEIPVFLMRFKGYSIVALEQLPASPLRTGAPFGGHQHR